MANPPKAKGTRFETAIVDFTLAAGFPARRVTLSGQYDQGDVHFNDGDGRLIVVEAKNRRGYAIAEAVDEAVREAANVAAKVPQVVFPLAVIKRNGVGDVGRAFAVTEYRTLLSLLGVPF